MDAVLYRAEGRLRGHRNEGKVERQRNSGAFQSGHNPSSTFPAPCQEPEEARGCCGCAPRWVHAFGGERKREGSLGSRLPLWCISLMSLPSSRIPRVAVPASCCLLVMSLSLPGTPVTSSSKSSHSSFRVVVPLLSLATPVSSCISELTNIHALREVVFVFPRVVK